MLLRLCQRDGAQADVSAQQRRLAHSPIVIGHIGQIDPGDIVQHIHDDRVVRCVADTAPFQLTRVLLGIVDHILDTCETVGGVGHQHHRVFYHMCHEGKRAFVRRKGRISRQRLGVKAGGCGGQRVLIPGALGGQIGIAYHSGTTFFVHRDDIHRTHIVFFNDLQDFSDHNVISAARAEGDHKFNVLCGDPSGLLP